MVALYRDEYQASQSGRIGITNNCDWREPKTSDPQDVGAAERCVEFWLGWFADPIFLGDYPESMKRLLGDRLPTFTENQKALLKGSADFFGLNHYGTGWVSNSNEPEWMECYGVVTEENLPMAESVWLFGAGWGLRKLLNWVHKRYDGPEIIITEGTPPALYSSSSLVSFALALILSIELVATVSFALALILSSAILLPCSCHAPASSSPFPFIFP